MHQVAREWASYTGRARLVLAFKGPMWGLYGACVGPVYGLHGAVLRRLQHPAASCSCQSGGATESSLSRLARPLGAHLAHLAQLALTDGSVSSQ